MPITIIDSNPYSFHFIFFKFETQNVTQSSAATLKN